MKIYYEEHGAGFPLVLAYGIGGNTQMWDVNVEALAARFRLILWDPRGHAGSESPADPAKYSFMRWAFDLRDLLDHLRRSFAEMLEQAIRRCQNRAIEAAQVIEELIALTRDMREADSRGEQLGLSQEESAFYDALEANDSAVKVLGDETLRSIAREPVATVRANVTIDWTVRENVRARLRVLVKRILRKHGCPPDEQEKATQTVLEQAEALSQAWAAA